MIDADDAVQGRFQNGGLARFTFPQGGIPLVDMVQHLIEGIGQQAQFVLPHFAGTDGKILPVGDRLGRLGQIKDRL